MKRKLFRNLSIIFFAAISLSSCTKYFNPEPVFEEYEQDQEKFVKRKVLVISVDGLVGRELEKKVPTHIAELIKKGKYSFGAITDQNTSDVASWVTLMTGYNSNKHNIIDDSYLPSASSDNPHGDISFSPSLIYRLESLEASLNTSIVVQDDGLANILLMDADNNVLAADDAKAKQEAITILQKEKAPDFMVVQFKDVLKAGKKSRFSADEAEYATAIQEVDNKIGEIVKALDDRENKAYEDWLIVVTSNHGGIDNSYGGESFAERNVFTVYAQKDFKSQELKSDMMNAMRFWGYSAAPAGIRALNTESGSSNDFNMDTSGELTVEVKYNWASPKTVEWSKNYTAVGDNTFWYAPLVAKKAGVGGGSVGWGFYSWNVNIVFSVSDGSKSINVETNRANGSWAILTGRIKKLTNGDAEVSIFRDGIFVQSQIIQGFNFAAANTNDFIVGYPNSVNYELPDFSLANVRIWKRALTDQEIRTNSCKGELLETDLNDSKILGEWNLNNVDNDKISNSVKNGRNLFFQGIKPAFFTEQLYTPCERDASEVLVQSIDLAPQVFYWLGYKPHDNWALSGKVFLADYELEFLK